MNHFGSPLTILDPTSRATLTESLTRAERRSHREGHGILLTMTVDAPWAADPAAAVFAGRTRHEPYFLATHPDGEALAAVGQCLIVRKHGPDAVRRAGEAIGDWAKWTVRCETPSLSATSDGAAIWVGGVAFDPGGRPDPDWEPLYPVQFVLSEATLRRRGGVTTVTLASVVHAGDNAADHRTRIERRLVSLAGIAPENRPVSGRRLPDSEPGSVYEAAVRAAVAAIAGGELKKVVLARRITVRGAADYLPWPLYVALRAAHPGTYRFCVGDGDTAFFGASPELLVQVRDGILRTTALAGTVARGATPDETLRLADELRHDAKCCSEQSIVRDWILDRVAGFCSDIEISARPEVIQLTQVQHLADQITGRFDRQHSFLEVVAALHPTPAVAGLPRQKAIDLIRRLEPFRRGWYAGTVGWLDANGQGGEVWAALRCARVHGPGATLFAGCGIVEGSDPAAELIETELKLQTMLSLLL